MQKNIFTSTFFIFLIMFLCINLKAQREGINPSPIKWGSIAKSDFNITVPSYSPDATSVTICRYGQTYVSETDSYYETHFDFHVRFIVLEKGGIDRANISIAFFSGSSGKSTVKKSFSGAYKSGRGGNEVRDIEGAVYNLDANGNIVAGKLQNDQIFVQDYSDVAHYGKVTFAMPNVKVGSIVEYKYTIIKRNIFTVENWYFQSENPCLHSEYRISFPDRKSYAVIKKGLLKDKIKFSESTLSSINSGILHNKVYAYELDSIPGLPDEPFVMSMRNFRTQVMIQISEVYNASTNSNIKIISTWKLLANDYKFDDQFGRIINKNSGLYAKLSHVWKKSEAANDKIMSCYNYVRDYFLCNNSWRTVATKNMKDIYEASVGSSAEINLFLAGFLKSAGFKPVMALVSTRDHGAINEKYPFISQFNHVICILKVDGKTMFLDASTKDGSYNFPPADIVDCKAFVIDPKNPELLTITTDAIFDKFVMSTVSVDGDSLKGKLLFRYKGYAAATQRKKLQDDSAAYFNDVVNEDDLLYLSNKIMMNTSNTNKPLLEQVNYSAASNSIKNDKLFYVNPFTIYGTFKNVLTSEKRKFPIEFNYPYKITYMYSVSIPDGYKIEDLPQNRNVAIHDNSASLLINYQSIGGNLQIKTELKINKMVFPVVDYENLKTLFNLWEVKHNEMIVLKKVE